MKKLWILVLLTVGVTAEAQEDFYNVANTAYEASTMVTPFRFLGWYSGRCAKASTPTIKFGALLTTYVTTTGVMKSAFWSEDGRPENYYDQLTPEITREIEEGMVQYDADLPPLLPHGDHWRATYNGTHIEETHTRANDSGIAVQEFHDGVQAIACIFTSKVHN